MGGESELGSVWLHNESEKELESEESMGYFGHLNISRDPQIFSLHLTLFVGPTNFTF